MPRHRHQVDRTTATVPAHTHTVAVLQLQSNGGGTGYYSGLNGKTQTKTTSSAGGGSTGAIAPYTNYIGNGTSFNNMPPYLVCNIWKRLS